MEKQAHNLSDVLKEVRRALQAYIYHELPADGGWRPISDQLCGRDYEEIYNEWIEHFARTLTEVSSLVETMRNQTKWPRGKYKAKFWLRARLQGACDLCHYLSEEINSLNTIPCSCRPTTAYETIIEHILQGRMDKPIAHFWMLCNVRWVTDVDHVHCPCHREIAAAEAWQESVERGRYLPPVHVLLAYVQ